MPLTAAEFDFLSVYVDEYMANLSGPACRKFREKGFVYTDVVKRLLANSNVHRELFIGIFKLCQWLAYPGFSTMNRRHIGLSRVSSSRPFSPTQPRIRAPIPTGSENTRAWSQRFCCAAAALGRGANFRLAREMPAQQQRLRTTYRLERIDDSDQFAASDAPSASSLKEEHTSVLLPCRGLKTMEISRNPSG